MIDKLIRAVLLLIGLLWFAGCGFIQSPSVPPQMVGTTSLNNFDFDGKPTQIQVQGVPERVIVARPEILDASGIARRKSYLRCVYYQGQGGADPRVAKENAKGCVLHIGDGSGDGLDDAS